MSHLLKTMSFACIYFIQLTSFAQQDGENFNTVNFPTTNYKPEPVNMIVTPDNGILLTYERSGSIPTYFQFSANCSVNTLLNVQINVADNENVQTITREMEITDNPALYEVPLQNYLASVLTNNPDAVIKSVLFTSKSKSKVMIKETNFSSISVKYPIGINQVFVMDMMNVNKQYFVHSAYSRAVNINIYNTRGELQKRTPMTLEPGDNFISLENIQDLRRDKYVILVTDATNTNISNTMAVMF